MNRHDDHHDAETAAPPRLVAALGSLANRRVLVPPAVDDAILGKAREHLEAVAAGRRIVRFPRWLAAAAACVVAAGAVGVWVHQHGTPPARESADLDRNGRVDILDAFALARELQRGSVSVAFDFDGDGRVDQRDVEALAARAVKLDGKRG